MEVLQIMKSFNCQASLALEKDDNPGPISAQILELCETDIFPEALQNSEVNSSSNCCYDENTSFTTNLFSSDLDHDYTNECLDPNQFQNENINSSTATTTTAANNSNYLSIIFDSHDDFDNDIAASFDFSTSPPFSGAPYLTITPQDHLDFSFVDPQVQLTDMTDPVVPLMAPMPPSVYQEDCLSMVPPFLRLNPSSSSSSYPFFYPSMETVLPGSLNGSLAPDSPGIFNGTGLVGSELQPKEPDYRGDSSGMFCSYQIQQVQNSNDILNLSNDNQQLVNGSVSTPISTEISSLEESTCKAGKLSVEQRKEKIHRYLKKRNQRNFSKKIKYACRKTLADSRPRVRGRFAKNDEFGDAQRHSYSQNEEDEYDEVSVKEEDDMIDSSDIFSHLSGVNSFKCSYASWI